MHQHHVAMHPADNDAWLACFMLQLHPSPGGMT